MIKTLMIILLFLTTSLFSKDFKKDQQRYKRVRNARLEKESGIKKLFKSKNISYPAKVFVRVFKSEAKLELYALKNKKYELVKKYDICSASGVIGPKRYQGDLQVPEGFYYINHFNPYSSYHLSLGVSYPNKSDKILKKRRDAGGAIYIHGDCVTIGCMPLTDDIIKELYIILVDSKDEKQDKIPVHVFPCKMNEEYCKKKMAKFPENKDFWKNIKIGYDYFEKNKVLPKVRVNKKGKYLFK